MATKILRLPKVLIIRGRSRSAHYSDIQEGLFTRPVSIGKRAVGWPEDEVHRLNAARIAGCSVKEIRILVLTLEDTRKTGIVGLGSDNHQQEVQLRLPQGDSHES
ncbi:MAG: AlpA family phage regulatory protein [Candidatus Thiodiazotropha sp. 6PLUC2]